MTTSFFAALLLFLTIPPLLNRLFGTSRLFPLVFVQLLFGLAIHISGLDAWLLLQKMDLAHGPLGASLSGLGWLGISLLIGLTGAEPAPEPTDQRRWRFVVISIAGFGTTALLGSAVGYWLAGLYPALIGSGADTLTFSLAVGLCLSVTALPVLLSILRDTGLAGTALGDLASKCALLDDLWLWLGMAGVLSLTAAGAYPGRLIVCLFIYIGAMFGLIKPLLRWWFSRSEISPPQDRLLISLTVILLSSIATDLIGLHAILGTFIAGTILPEKATAGWREQVLMFNQTLLLPFFFILTGLRLDLQFQQHQFLAFTAVVTLAAMAGKFFSVALAARATGLAWRDAFLLGNLMQCKGLMELVAINILLDAGVIGTQMFTALAMMALISTFVTAPVLRLFWKR